ncbi:MAG: hypothetical protein EOP54_11490 [Sphingobacteriales bacterium]|nr:MAG: hypothetical protein EOP54_11490 [Sphingobacteriales bacterium]
MKQLLILTGALSLMLACNKSKIEDIDVPKSTGSTIQVNGLIGSESGASAGNMVFIDFSKDLQTPLVRANWDLAFYCGNQNRVLINNSTAAMAIVIDKTDLDAVTAADVSGQTFEVDITDPNPATFKKVDDLKGNLDKTVVPEITATASKVVVIGRGTGGGTPRRDLVKAQFRLTANGEYEVKWSKIGENNYQTATIAKDEAYNFKYVSFDNGLLTTAEPAKFNWDIVWGASIYETLNGSVMSAYIFSDMVGVNYLAGVTTLEKKYEDEATATQAFNTYSLAEAQAETFDHYRWAIGANWRQTAAPGVTNAGVNKKRFYIVKDPQGNYYKLKFLSFTTEDGGTRGKPELKYELLK